MTLAALLQQASQSPSTTPDQPLGDAHRVLRASELETAVCVCGHLVRFHRTRDGRQLSCADAAVREIVALEQIGSRHAA